MLGGRLSSYEVSNDELIDRLVRTAAMAGREAESTILDPNAGGCATGVFFLKGVLRARMFGDKPPYDPGMQVFVRKEQGVPEKLGLGPTLLFDTEHTIRRVWYLGRSWYLEFNDVDEGATHSPVYHVSGFSRVKPVQKRAQKTSQQKTA